MFIKITVDGDNVDQTDFFEVFKEDPNISDQKVLDDFVEDFATEIHQVNPDQFFDVIGEVVECPPSEWLHDKINEMSEQINYLAETCNRYEKLMVE